MGAGNELALGKLYFGRGYKRRFAEGKVNRAQHKLQDCCGDCCSEDHLPRVTEVAQGEEQQGRHTGGNEIRSDNTRKEGAEVDYPASAYLPADGGDHYPQERKHYEKCDVRKHVGFQAGRLEHRHEYV